MRTIYRHLLDNREKNIPLALATVTGAQGSTPQKPGSSALFGPDGLIAGTVGGGLVEGEISRQALKHLKGKTSFHYHFNLNPEAGEEGALCGGKISILVDGNPLLNVRAIEALDRSIRQRIPGGLLTRVSNTDIGPVTIKRQWISTDPDAEPPDGLDRESYNLLREKILKTRYSKLADLFMTDMDAESGSTAFLEAIHPFPRLIIAGAGHIGKAVAHLGNLLDFEVTVIDDRAEYANPVNLPDADYIIVGEIGESMVKADPDRDTYVVIVTRGHRHDADALRSCIKKETAYTGMIGSDNKVKTLRKRFMSESWATPVEWKAVHAPIGLDIGSKTIQEIAVSITAQLVQERYKRNNANG